MNRKKCFDAICRLLTLVAAVLALAAIASATWKEKVLYSFQGLPDGATPAGGVVFDQAGNLYGATTDGGANNCPGITECGTVYQLKPPVQKGRPWTESVLYVFQGVNANDGETPAGGVLFDPAGNLYGTTAYGGSGGCKLFGSRVGCGTIYKMVPPKQKGGAWTESVIYSFKGGNDGYLPEGGLTFDTYGNLYGATQYGGGFGSCNAPYYQYCGTVFKLSPPKTKGGKWTEKVLYSFKSGEDGANPNGGLVLDNKGAIYGTSYAGGGTSNCQGAGTVGCGTAFKLTPPITKGGAWTEKMIHRFQGGAKDTNSPAAGLIWAQGGGLYGTTAGGQNSGGDDGAIFRLMPAKLGRPWHESILHTFCRGKDGCAPTAGLVSDQAGDLYGVAPVGAKFSGMVFRLRNIGPVSSWQYNVLYNFQGVPDGFGPGAALALDKLGNLYGTTLGGGAGQSCRDGCGTVFEVKP